MVFCLNQESNDVPSWKNIGTHTDYYYLSRKFCFYVFNFLFHEKSGKNIANLVKTIIDASYYMEPGKLFLDIQWLPKWIQCFIDKV